MNITSGLDPLTGKPYGFKILSGPYIDHTFPCDPIVGTETIT